MFGVFFLFFFSQLVKEDVLYSVLFLLREREMLWESLLTKQPFLDPQRRVRRQEVVVALTYLNAACVSKGARQGDSVSNFY